jgi:gliding motility-associated-like protein
MLMSFKAKSQLVVDFSSNVTEACAPVNISFTNTTTGCLGSISYSWLSGNGDASTQENPTFSYYIGGTYTVSLTVTCDGTPTVVTHNIVIHNGPQVSFDETHQYGCIPYNASFTNLSTPGDAPISTYSWNFGDGNVSFLENPNHTYPVTGQFSVSLNVTDANGCATIHSFPQLVTVSTPPQINFSANQTTNCVVPFTTQFSANISTLFGLGYDIIWNFQGGIPTVANIQNPSSILYNIYGNYDVTLTVTDAAGCTATLTQEDYIQIGPAQALYNIVNNRQVACKNENIQITNETNYNCLWTYNGTQTSTLNTIIVNYPNSGTYPITFTIDPGGECETTANFNIEIEQVTASFSTNITDNFYCGAPLNANFTNTSGINAITFNYNLGNGISSNLPNPTFSLPAGQYQPILIVTTATGCTANFIGNSFTVYNPTIGIATNNNHCVPQTTTFEFANFSFPLSDVVSSSWTFGNGNVNTSGGSPVSTTYTQGGSFIVHLQVTDINGCEINYDTLVSFGTHYIPNINIIPFNNICPQDSAALIVIDDHDTCSYNCNVIYQWHIFNSDYDYMVDYDDNTTYHKFDQDTGFMNIEIYINHNSCLDTLTWSGSIYVNPPLIYDITGTANSCQDAFNYTFYVNSYQADNFDWKIFSLDENNIETIEYTQNSSTSSSLSHLFTSIGEYWVRVTAHNITSGCEFADSILITVAEAPLAVISPLLESTYCSSTNIIFNSENSLNTEGGISWNFGDGTPTSADEIATHQYTVGGNYTITLTVSNINSCTSTATIPLTIAGVSISFSAVDSLGCQENLHTIFHNTSISNDGVQNVIWTFHDGSNQFGDDATFDYFGFGTYSVILTVTTNHNCIIQHLFENCVVLSQLNPNFTISQINACAYQEIIFSANEVSANCTYTWSFGDGVDSVTNNPVISYIYQDGGTYSVSLDITNTFGCQNNSSIPNAINVVKIEAEYTLSNSTFACYPAQLELFSNVTTNPGSLPITYHWDFDNGDVSVIDNPAYVYSQPGNYDIQLIVTTTFGCSDTVTQNVIINGPFAEMLVSKDSICIGESVDFEIINMQNVDDFLWVVGNGITSTESTFSHIYDVVPPQGYFNITLTISSIINNDTCKVFFNKIIYLSQVTANFDMLYDSICSPLNSFLTNSSQNDNNRVWFLNGEPFGNGNNSENIFIENISQVDEASIIKLVVTNSFGCIDSISKNVIIFPNPIVNAPNDTLICEGDTIQFSVFSQENYLYNWYPNNNISATNIFNPYVYPNNSINYIIITKNEHNCESTDTVKISVQNKAIINFDQSDVNIIVGEIVDINITEIANFEDVTYSWTPNYRISCLDCLNLTVQPLHNTTYKLRVTDKNDCFPNDYEKNIIVREIFTADVPTGFTPLSDDGNNIIYLKGYGIKKLKQFRIYNRWGQEVFYTDDLTKGWDGTVNGTMQNTDNYGYMFEVEMYDDQTQVKKGTFMLIK